MAPKFFFFNVFPLVIIILSMVITFRLSSAGTGNVIVYFGNAMTSPTYNDKYQVTFRIKTSIGDLKDKVVVVPGADHHTVLDMKTPYYATAKYGSKRSEKFRVYDKTRDKQHRVVWWTVDPEGVKLAYDGSDWKPIAGWKAKKKPKKD